MTGSARCCAPYALMLAYDPQAIRHAYAMPPRHLHCMGLRVWGDSSPRGDTREVRRQADNGGLLSSVNTTLLTRGIWYP